MSRSRRGRLSLLTALLMTAIAGSTMTVRADTVTLLDVMFTGAELDNQVTLGNASYPYADLMTVTGTRLDLSPPPVAGGAAILFRMPIISAGALATFENLVVTITVDWVQLTGDNDFGIAISDGTSGIGGMQHISQIPAQVGVDRLLPILRDEHHVILTRPLRVV